MALKKCFARQQTRFWKRSRSACKYPPPTGAVLIYGGPEYDNPVLVTGPESEAEIDTRMRTVIVQKIRGAQTYQIKTLGYLAKRPIEPPTDGLS